MKKLFVAMTAVALTGCGGPISPELYNLVIDYFTLPNSCYQDGLPPDSSLTTSAPTLYMVQVWDGPEGGAFLQVEEGTRTIEMGQSPDVTLTGVWKGLRDSNGWKFTLDYVSKTTLGQNTLTNTSHAELLLQRGPTTFVGTAAISSSSNCVGSQCSNINPSCAVAPIALKGTRIATDFERAP